MSSTDEIKKNKSHHDRNNKKNSNSISSSSPTPKKNKKTASKNKNTSNVNYSKPKSPRMTVIVTRKDLLDGAAAVLAETRRRLKPLDLGSSCWDLEKVAKIPNNNIEDHSNSINSTDDSTNSGDDIFYDARSSLSSVENLTISTSETEQACSTTTKSSATTTPSYQKLEPVKKITTNPNPNLPSRGLLRRKSSKALLQEPKKSEIPNAIILPFAHETNNKKQQQRHQKQQQQPLLSKPSNKSQRNTAHHEIAVIRAAYTPPSYLFHHPSLFLEEYNQDCTIPNPFPQTLVHDKYWNQRHRLFSKFDNGIILDAQGWYSVTPEVIAKYVARQVVDFLSASDSNSSSSSSHDNSGVILLDAFCGCGGNAIAFALESKIDLVVCIDLDYTKLEMAAHNASLYHVPPSKLLFVHANSLEIMKLYKNGILLQDKQKQKETPYSDASLLTTPHGYTIIKSNITSSLPPNINAIFMDPPWGGMNYLENKKHGYDLQKHMKISKNTNGFQLLKIAAESAPKKVIYDLPRNVNKVSLGKSALNAGYSRNCKLEEHFINGRKKTVTAYFGHDFTHELR